MFGCLLLSVLSLSCANLNDGEIKISDDISIFRSGDSATFLMSKRKINFDLSRFVIIRLGKKDGLLALEVWERKTELSDKIPNDPPSYFVIDLRTLEVFGQFNYASFQEYLKKISKNIPLASPYNLEAAGIN
jgi:hypothetical protein